jgi:hypothetical protein
MHLHIVDWPTQIWAIRLLATEAERFVTDAWNNDTANKGASSP